MPRRVNGPRLRDASTIETLLTAVGHLSDVVPVQFRRWWDGSAWVPCLTVRGGRNWRVRVVETCGQVVVLPSAQQPARRRLAALRRVAPDDQVAPTRSLARRLARRPVRAIARSVALPPAVELRYPSVEAARTATQPHRDRRLASASPVTTGRPGGGEAPPNRERPVRLVVAAADAVRCRHPNCGGLLRVPPPGETAPPDEVCGFCGRR